MIDFFEETKEESKDAYGFYDICINEDSITVIFVVDEVDFFVKYYRQSQLFEVYSSSKRFVVKNYEEVLDWQIKVHRYITHTIEVSKLKGLS